MCLWEKGSHQGRERSMYSGRVLGGHIPADSVQSVEASVDGRSPLYVGEVCMHNAQERSIWMRRCSFQVGEAIIKEKSKWCGEVVS